MLEPSIDMARDFIEWLTGYPNTAVTFQTFDESKKNNRGLARVFHGPLDDQIDALCALQNQGAGVFVMVNEGDGIIRPNRKTCRTNDNVTRVRALFVDLDGAPLEPVLNAAIPPSIVVISSPGRYHVYWSDVDCALDDFATAQKSLANRFNGDPSVCDLSRVMRLPGFWHQKAEPYMTSIRA